MGDWILASVFVIHCLLLSYSQETVEKNKHIIGSINIPKRIVRSSSDVIASSSGHSAVPSNINYHQDSSSSQHEPQLLHYQPSKSSLGHYSESAIPYDHGGDIAAIGSSDIGEFNEKEYSDTTGYQHYKTATSFNLEGPKQLETITTHSYHKEVEPYDVSHYTQVDHKEEEQHAEVHYHQHKHLHKHRHDQEHHHKHEQGHKHHHHHGHDHKSHHSHQHEAHNQHHHQGEHKHEHRNEHHHQHHQEHKHSHWQSHKHKHEHKQHHKHDGHHAHKHHHHDEHKHEHHNGHKHAHHHDHKHDNEHKHWHDHHQHHKHQHHHDSHHKHHHDDHHKHHHEKHHKHVVYAKHHH